MIYAKLTIIFTYFEFQRLLKASGTVQNVKRIWQEERKIEEIDGIFDRNTANHYVIDMLLRM